MKWLDTYKEQEMPEFTEDYYVNEKGKVINIPCLHGQNCTKPI